MKCNKGNGIGCFSKQVSFTDHFTGGKGIVRDFKDILKRINSEQEITNEEREAIRAQLRLINEGLDQRGSEGVQEGQEADRAAPGSDGDQEGYQVNEPGSRSVQNRQQRGEADAPTQGDLFAPSGVPSETAKAQTKDNFIVVYKFISKKIF